MYYKKMHRKHLCRKKRTTQLSTHPVTPRNLCHRCPVDRDWCTCLQCLWDSSTLRDRWGARWCLWHSQPRRGRSIYDLDTACSCPHQAGPGTLLEPDWDLVILLCLLGCSFVTAIKAVLNSQNEWVFFPRFHQTNKRNFKCWQSEPSVSLLISYKDTQFWHSTLDFISGLCEEGSCEMMQEHIQIQDAFGWDLTEFDWHYAYNCGCFIFLMLTTGHQQSSLYGEMGCFLQLFSSTEEFCY